MKKTSNLEKEYIRLLALHGLQPRRSSIDVPEVQEFLKKVHQKENFGEPFNNKIYKELSKFNDDDVEKLCESLSYGCQDDIHQLSQEIQRGINACGYSLDIEVFTGEFPTGSFNAQACPVPGGVLILLNTGLFTFISQVLEILSCSMSFYKFDSCNLPTKAKIVKNNADIAKALAEILIAYLLCEEPTVVRDISSKIEDFNRCPHVNTYTCGILEHDCEKFAIAHEYGHVTLGHLTHPRTALLKTIEGDVKVALKKQKQEFAADLRGMDLMLASIKYDKDTSNELDYISAFPSTVAAPIIFFSLDELIIETVNALTGKQNIPIITDHPQSKLRSKRLRSVFAYFGMGKILSMFGGKIIMQHLCLADLYTSLLSMVKTETIDIVCSTIKKGVKFEKRLDE